MYSVYVLKSLKSLKQYVGITSQSLDERLQEHSSGASKWTQSHRPFKLVYSERFENKTAALKRERFFKTGDGRRVLTRLIKKNYSPPKSAAENNLLSQIIPK